MSNTKWSMRAILAIALLPLLFLSVNAFGQSGASLSGTVMDTSQAVLPGAGITAINTQTGVETKTTANNVGIYSFPSLQPGVYNIVTEADGFQKATKTDVKLGMAAQIRLNFEMAVAGTATEVEVATTAESMILDAGSSTGNVMQEELVSELPLVGNDVMDLLNTMGGVVKAEDPIFAAHSQTFAGVSSGNINIQRDGVSVNEVRYTSGIVSPNRINQEMVGEFKMVLSPVDAEMGRGAGQVQIMTKSGSNAFHGSGVWNIQNTALDAREFEAKRMNETPSWRNLNNYTISASGPIIRNKTFFFASWDQQLVRSKAWLTVSALTNCARKGIYRYYPGVVSINAADNTNYAANPYPHEQAVVSLTDGTPLRPASATGDLMYQSVFGPLDATALAQIAADPVECSQYTAPGIGNAAPGVTSLFFAPNQGLDQTGYVSKYLTLLPEANYYGYGDGLNTAGYKWWRATSGINNIFGTGEDNRRKSITVKIDHNINNAHRLSGTYTLEKNVGEDGGRVWPENSYIGETWRRPQSLTASLTSTVSPTLLNEFRFGFSRLTGIRMSSRDTAPQLDPILNDLMSDVPLPNYDVSHGPIVYSYDALSFGPGTSAQIGGVSSPYSSRGIMNSTWGGTDHRWTFADTVTWMKGAHSFKGGFELRLAKSWYTTDGEGGFYGTSSAYPMITGGYRRDFSAAMPPFMVPAAFTGLMAKNIYDSNSNQYSTILNMAGFLNGSVSNVRQFFYIEKDGAAYRWNDVQAGEKQFINDFRTREFSFFFKDDWKVTSDLTLNLGVRYEYYGVPWNETGLTAVLDGGSSNILGISGGNPWMDWLGFTSDGGQTNYTFVGPNSPNSGRSAWNKDMNNFAPHVGFAWQLPWFGKGKTTLRGGYSISYSPIGNADFYKTLLGAVPGTTKPHITANSFTDPYINFANVGDYIGVSSPAVAPMATIFNRQTGVGVVDDNIKNPYIQSFNMSLTRRIGNTLTVDVRYIGTLARNQNSTTNINTPRYMDNGLFEEFEYARSGGLGQQGWTPLLDQIFPLGPQGDSVTQLMSQFSMVTYGSGATLLANGDYAGLASVISTAGGNTDAGYGTYLNASGLGSNFIYTNPQFNSATLYGNDGLTNYHSMQAQVTMRPVRGLSFQATYTWSRNLIDQGVGDYSTGARRYYLSAQHRSHALTTYGSYELPFGANGFLFRNATGAFKKVVEGWSLSWVGSVSSGLPGSIGAARSYWNYSDPVVEDWDNWDSKAGKTTLDWRKGGVDGVWDSASFFGDKYVKVPDPQCTDGTIAASVYNRAGGCNLKALALASDPTHIVVRNARPGEVGNLSPNSLTGPGRWNLDMAMSKSIEFMEGKRIEFRIDAQNIFNHPMPSNSAFAWNARFTAISNPNFALNNDTKFGYMATKGGHRTFQGKLRISF